MLFQQWRQTSGRLWLVAWGQVTQPESVTTSTCTSQQNLLEKRNNRRRSPPMWQPQVWLNPSDIHPNCREKYWHYPYPLPPESISITSKVGTLKRRRKIRDVLQQFDQGYTDDIFESTPFKKMKRVQVWPYTCAIEGQMEGFACKIRDLCY